MRTALLAVIFPNVLAGWNPKACNGAGGCTFVGFSPSDPFLCPDSSRENFPEFVNDQSNAGNGDSAAVTKEEFPKACIKGNVPPEGATFIVRFLLFRISENMVERCIYTKHDQKANTRHNQTMYFYVNTTCNDLKPVEPFNCYNRNRNSAV